MNEPSLTYSLKRSRRRSLSIQVQDDGRVEVRAPLRLPQRQIDDFLIAKSAWIHRKQTELRSRQPILRLDPAEADKARRLLVERLNGWVVRFAWPQPSQVIVRDFVSRWGSCTAARVIRINERCAALPDSLQDYVLLHELCHLRHLDHGPKFWGLLRSCLPDADERRRRLAQYRLRDAASPEPAADLLPLERLAAERGENTRGHGTAS